MTGMHICIYNCIIIKPFSCELGVFQRGTGCLQSVLVCQTVMSFLSLFFNI